MEKQLPMLLLAGCTLLGQAEASESPAIQVAAATKRIVPSSVEEAYDRLNNLLDYRRASSNNLADATGNSAEATGLKYGDHSAVLCQIDPSLAAKDFAQGLFFGNLDATAGNELDSIDAELNSAGATTEALEQVLQALTNPFLGMD